MNEPVPGYEPGLSDNVEREPAPRKTLRLPGDRRKQIKERYYFGPTYRSDGGPGMVWKFRHAEYDAAKDVTTAWFAPVGEHELNSVLAELHKRGMA